VSRDVTLLIKLNDQASGKIGKITNSTKQLERAANGAQNSIRRTNKGIRDTGKTADIASRGVNKLGRAVRGLIAGFGLFQAGKFVIFKTAELERQTKSLEVLTGSLGNARSIIKELQQFGAVTPFTSAELIETAKRLKAFGFETEKIVDVTKRLADVAGATGADLGGIATAFGQIQAKGRLQGEELLQLQERGIGLQDELQKMYKMTGEEFRKALEGGRISAEAVNVALQNITNEGGKYANGAIAQSETLSGKFSTLVDNITVLAQHIGTALSPALKGILSLTNQILAGFNDILSSQVARGVATTKLAMLTPGGTMGDIAQMRANVSAMPTTTLRDDASIQETARRLTDISNFVRELGAAIETRRPGGTTGEERQALEGLQGLIQTQLAALGQRQKQIAVEEKPKEIKPPELLTRQTKTGETPEQKAARELAALKESMALSAEKEAARTQDVIRGKQQELEVLTLTAEKGGEFAAFTQRVRDLVEDGVPFSEAFELEDAIRKQQELIDQQASMDQLYTSIGNSIKTGINDALMGAIQGTKTLGEAASSILSNIGNQLISFGLDSIFGGLGGGGGIFGKLFGGGRANGGTVQGGRSYVVGEKGPELFTPGRTGSVAPNSSMGGNISVNVNVDASGSAIQGDGNEGAQLGKAIGAAVQQELMKQKRPGGLLAGV
jgi:tape measure domain-containing protein